jgi:hypothetical protein
MFTINDKEKEFILDLNKLPYDEHEIHIDSKASNGRDLPWGVEIVSSKLISATRGAGNLLNISLGPEKLNEDAFILLRNYNKERLKIVVKHNVLLTMDRKYKFRISKKTTDGRKTRIRILSKVDNDEIGWKCTYDGKPLNYSISPMESDKSGYVDIEVLDELFTNVPSVIEFTQDRSREVISLKLNQTNDDTEIIKAD